jgi:hypothetical protein
VWHAWARTTPSINVAEVVVVIEKVVGLVAGTFTVPAYDGDVRLTGAGVTHIPQGDGVAVPACSPARRRRRPPLPGTGWTCRTPSTRTASGMRPKAAADAPRASSAASLGPDREAPTAASRLAPAGRSARCGSPWL